MINLVSFASNSHKFYQDDLNRQAMQYGLRHYMYGEEWLRSTDAWKTHPDIFTVKRGYGCWSWKSMAILNAMSMLPENEVVLYLDASTFLREDPTEMVMSHVPEVLTAVQTCFPCREWTKRDCFIEMGCDSEEYWNANQVWAGVIITKVCDAAKAFIKEWQDYCLNYKVVSDAPSIVPNFPEFQAHREDQSILSNLVIKHKLSTFETQLFMDR